MHLNSQRVTPVASDNYLPGSVLTTDSPLVGVLVDQHERRLIAVLAIADGTRLFKLEGHETAVPTRYSLQVGPAVHLDQSDAHDPVDRVRRRFWRYMNHSCDPTTVIRNREVFARRDIAPGESISFDYNTTEYDMASPFECACGSAVCVGVIRGAKHLSPEDRARLGTDLAEYLR